MLPQISQIPALDGLVGEFLDELRAQKFSGDIDASYSARLALATDNSVYQYLPQAILYPRLNDDIALVAKISNEEKFKSLSFTPRGGGTGTNAQALNDNIIIDFSRHMNQILEFDEKNRRVKVQAGVVKDELNDFLRPYGLFFAPELSTSNRACIGGMISTDASGQGSLKYGKTSDHILAIKAVLLNGEILETSAIKTENFDENLSNLSPTAKKLHKEIYELCSQNRDQIINDLPNLNRFLTGYDLKNVFNKDMSEFNLTRIITGSEGTLAFVCEATLDLTPIPKIRTLINVKYKSFDAALRNAPFLLDAKALSVETIDSRVLNLAKGDIIWHSVKDLLKENSEEILGLNIVEFAGDESDDIQTKISLLCKKLDEKIAQKQDDIIGYELCTKLDDIAKIYAMRKKAVGLLGNTKGSAKPLPFVEDTCVPPQNLADYVTEFRALLDSFALEYGMFGHVDAGVLHVRPILDLCDENQKKLFKKISDSVADLTAKYGGLLWGEHGKGVRSFYAEKFFTPKLWDSLRYVKFLFDPNNRLNPGKICTPQGSDAKLYAITDKMRSDYDAQIPNESKINFKGALECNGNGLCFNYDLDNAMCPSMKVLRNRIHSPKGRAGLVREWLRLMNAQGVSPQMLDFRTSKPKLSEFVSKFSNTLAKIRGEYDFSNEVKDAMDTCLACKACASQCPIKIDVPSFRSKFFYLYHLRYQRPLKDYVIANLETFAPYMAKGAWLLNAVTGAKITQKIVDKTLGLTALPALTTPTLSQQLAGYKNHSLEELKTFSEEKKANMVLIVQDPFTSYYDACVVADFVKFCARIGFTPVLLPFKPNGKAQHIKGFLNQFARTAKNQAQMLNEVAKLGMPLVGVDPAIVLSYRDEYKEILGDDRGDFFVQTSHEWLKSIIDSGKITLKNNSLKESKTWYLFPHCQEQTAMPNSPKQWQEIFEFFGQNLEILKVGCCGMAGIFGHESKNQAVTKAIYDSSWGAKLKGKDIQMCLSAGYSCRSQVGRFEGKKPKHPVQALLSVL
ncbi:MAG: FAD-binding oxidoreductase [Campylobacter sp.]|nr:FAD-binding oxidoreductase [Campylobacter sp.]